MTVQELIEELQKFSPALDVEIEPIDYCGQTSDPVNSVLLDSENMVVVIRNSN